MLLRVALEYGQTWCAFSMSACASALSTPGSVMVSATSSPKPPAARCRPGDDGGVRRDLGAALRGDELHRPQEAGLLLAVKLTRRKLPPMPQVDPKATFGES